jgi:armadillo repeat-containing protein 8
MAMTELAATREISRTQLVEHPIVVQTIASILSCTHQHLNTPSLLIAACRCLTSLSRSVKLLRTTLVDFNVGELLFSVCRNAIATNTHTDLDSTDDKLFSWTLSLSLSLARSLSACLFQLVQTSKYVQVQIRALEALCNFVLDFSPTRSAVLASKPLLHFLIETATTCGLSSKSAADSTSYSAALCLNAVWCLRNLLFKATAEVKRVILNDLTPETLLAYVI